MCFEVEKEIRRVQSLTGLWGKLLDALLAEVMVSQRVLNLGSECLFTM